MFWSKVDEGGSGRRWEWTKVGVDEGGSGRRWEWTKVGVDEGESIRGIMVLIHGYNCINVFSTLVFISRV